MEFNIVITDNNFNMVMLKELRENKQKIIHHMVQNKKSFMRYKGFFVNLVECEAI